MGFVDDRRFPFRTIVECVILFFLQEDNAGELENAILRIAKELLSFEAFVLNERSSIDCGDPCVDLPPEDSRQL